tara:strand:- start:122 stop:298 length:177 start_codon:yes stop_codon:yes gene_type:complete
LQRLTQGFVLGKKVLPLEVAEIGPLQLLGERQQPPAFGEGEYGAEQVEECEECEKRVD